MGSLAPGQRRHTWLRRTVGAYFILQTAINVGTLVAFHQAIKDRLIVGLLTAHEVPLDQVISSADASYSYSLIAALLYGALQIALAGLTLRLHRSWVYIVDAIWLATLAVFGLTFVVGFRPGQALVPDARVYGAAAMGVLAVPIALWILLILVQRGRSGHTP